MNIKIVFNGSYPIGRACTNRGHLYAKGLAEAGNNVEVIIHRPTEVYGYEILNKEISGVYDGIPFCYTAGTTLRSKKFIVRRFYDLKGILISGWLLFKNRKNIDALIFLGIGLTQSLYYKIITSICGILYLHHKVEISFLYQRPNAIKKMYQKLYVKYLYRIFDGFIVISENLQNYLVDKISKKAKMVLIPILSNSCEFNDFINSTSTSLFTIFYAGTLCQKKDGVLDLIRSMKIIIEKNYDAHLFIVGDTQNQDDKRKIHELISELDLEKYISLTGFISRKAYLELLNQADLLVLAKPKSIEAEYCFPTKLGEYLLTGKPVLITRTGVIPNYIIDGTNGYLAEPDNCKDFAEKIETIINDYDNAIISGKAGRELAMKEFDYKNNGIKLNKFISDLLEEKKNNISRKIKINSEEKSIH